MTNEKTLSGESGAAGDYRSRGLMLHREGKTEQALEVLSAGAALFPENDEIPATLALIMHESGDISAVEYCKAAINANPAEAKHKELLIDILSAVRLRAFHPHVCDLVELCLQTREIDHQKLMMLWLLLVKTDPRLSPFYALGEKKDYKSFRKAFAKARDRTALLCPFFLLGLQSLIVGDLAFERLLTWLRRFLLEEGREGQRELLKALAVYCYHTEYAFGVMGEEERAVRSLVPADADDVLMLSCYGPFYALDDSEGLAAVLEGEGGMAEFLKTQYYDYRAQQEIRNAIPALTSVSNEVSQSVREQYEGFPYPRWKTLKGSISLNQLEDFLGTDPVRNLKKDGARILIAGCGTGHQALEYGIAFPKAEILAIDLSLSSLAYAVQKQRERGIGNVVFRQADILEMKEPREHFDLIVCTGVLHHMQDPLAGWAALTRLLKPGGLMRIALYSELARGFIVRGREVIEQEGYAADAAGIRRFRADAPKLLEKRDMEMVAGSLDFYSLSECRDMLFHVQEHRYTIPRIRDELAALGLSFVKFEVPVAVRAQYHMLYPDDDLAHWDEFERKNNLLFLQMYRFWCQRGS